MKKGFLDILLGYILIGLGFLFLGEVFAFHLTLLEVGIVCVGLVRLIKFKKKKEKEKKTVGGK